MACLRGARLVGAKLSGADLRVADLRGADLGDARLAGADLGEASLSAADLSRTDLSRTNLSKANLSGTNLNSADLSEANLSGANLGNANLSSAVLNNANLSNTNLKGADLRWIRGDVEDLAIIPLDTSRGNPLDTCQGNFARPYRSVIRINANLSNANLSGANLSEANLQAATLLETNLIGADLAGCRIYGVSTWGLKLEGAKQQNLVITSEDEAEITVDNIEVAQFIYLMLHNQKVRDVIDTITSKAVLILGRFTADRKAVLDALREELRKRNYLPILFDFDVPATRDITETVSLLARMARFIIADLTDPSNIPKELEAIVPHLAVPVQPLLEGSSRPYAMFKDYWKYDWVLPVCRYEGLEPLLATLAEKWLSPLRKER
jgi:uncharacterized protein YjbI with pentapeptide repeats